MFTKRITRQKRQQIISLRDKNYAHKYIAEKVGCHRNTVGKILKQEGLA
ncbi:helix-turn-helix domain-containing protein [Colwellia psychrerythraea]|uniref:Transposase IS30-like HTH domain-containing protein n=1 Tax=Colwellia psychrerythraea TaxID=28229 RepID=A0A099KTX8_COLPS|nr:helix-turn-helix domain-containing protein [Colwellia psychrerythraea]KGJ93332.1 hypothetical protein GAB14E_2656 [Colwellia psychrerythraea]